MKLERERSKGKQGAASFTNPVLELILILLWSGLFSYSRHFVFPITSASLSDFKKIKFKFKQYRKCFLTDYRSVSSQESAPEEPKIDKGMLFASLNFLLHCQMYLFHALTLGADFAAFTFF